MIFTLCVIGYLAIGVAFFLIMTHVARIPDFADLFIVLFWPIAIFVIAAYMEWNNW